MERRIFSEFEVCRLLEKNKLLARVLRESENGVKLIKTAVEVEANTKKEYLTKLNIDDRTIPDPILHGRMKKWGHEVLVYALINIYF